MYGVGFTENASNFQTNNFRLGGKAGDAVLAEVQVGNDTNNSNFAATLGVLRGRAVKQGG